MSDENSLSGEENWQLPEKMQKDLRQWLHDVRGSVSIVASTLEMLSQEDMHPVAVKYLQIVQRQIQRILMESELWGAHLHFRPEVFEEGICPVVETFTEMQDLIGTNVDVALAAEGGPVRVRLSPYLLKLVFLAVLIPPSGLDPRVPLRCVKSGDEWFLEFGWSASAALLPKFQWADGVLRRQGARLEVVPGVFRIVCPCA